jgi:hypothetical protein
LLVVEALLALTPNHRIAARMKHSQDHDSRIFDDVVDKEREVASSCPPDVRENRRGSVRRLCYQRQRLFNARDESVSDTWRATFIPFRRIGVLRLRSAPENN